LIFGRDNSPHNLNRFFAKALPSIPSSIPACSSKFQGKVVNVPFIKTPGFNQVRTIQSNHMFFPDAFKYSALQIIAKSNYQPYESYHIRFGNAHAPGEKFFADGYKANLRLINDIGLISILSDDFTNF
jgi:hypothetical protein